MSGAIVTIVLLISPTMAVPAADASPIARSIASRISGAYGSGRRRRAAITPRIHAMKLDAGGT